MSSTLDYTVSDGYIQLPVTTDPTTLQSNALATLASELPGWVPREGHIEVLLLEQFAAMAAESATVASQVPEAIFSYFGSLIGITPIQGAYAVAQSTWTMADNAGYSIPANTVVGYQVLGNETYLFSNVSAFTIPNGSTATAPGAVTIQAQSVGSAYNGLDPQALTLITSVAYISSIETTNVSSGGADQETTTAYINRLSNELQLLTPRPILPNDFAALAQSVAGVYRAAAFNGLNPYANILVAADTTFAGGGGTWTVTQNGAKSTGTGSYSESTLELTASTLGTNMIATTGSYPVAQLQNYLAMLTFDESSIAATVEVGVNIYDVNGSLLNTYTSPLMLDSTTKLTYAWVGFETPANAFTSKLFLEATTPTSGATHQVAYAALMEIATPINLVPDSSLNKVVSGLTWIGSGSPGANPPASLAILPYITGQNSFVYTGTGSASGTIPAHSLRTYLPAGSYIASALLDASNCTVGGPQFTITNDAATVLATGTQTVGVAGLVSATFTLGSPAVVQFNFSTNNATVQSGLTLTMTAPQIAAGAVVPAYTPGPTWGAAGLTTSNERTVTVAAVDVNGDALNGTIETTLSNYLAAQREVNFIVDVIGPSYTGVDVTWSGVAATGANPNTVLSAANASLNAYLSPADWAGGTATPPYWDSTQNVVRYLSVVTLLGETPGLDHLVSVEIGYHGISSLGTSDVDLNGLAPLPQAGTITGNVTAIDG